MRSRSAIVSFAALLLALSLRVLVPTGWMPAPEGGFRIIPCVAAAPKPQASALHGHHDRHGHRQQQDQHHPQEHDGGAKDCPFAPLLAAAALPKAVATKLTPLAPAPTPAVARHLRAALPAGPPSPPPPSTGPPTLA